MNRALSLKLSLLLAAVIVVTGCATAPKPARLTLNISSAATINPDLNGRPSPVVLRIYSLKGSSIFNNARFVELYSNSKDVLGGDFLAVEEIEISPGESLNLKQRELPSETRHIGVLAAFRDIDRAVWRGSVDIEADEKFDLNIAVNNLTITLQKD